MPLRRSVESKTRPGNETNGWGGRVRTSEWRNQNPLPYHLATPQCRPVDRASLVLAIRSVHIIKPASRRRKHRGQNRRSAGSGQHGAGDGRLSQGPCGKQDRACLRSRLSFGSASGRIPRDQSYLSSSRLVGENARADITSARVLRQERMMVESVRTGSADASSSILVKLCGALIENEMEVQLLCCRR